MVTLSQGTPVIPSNAAHETGFICQTASSATCRECLICRSGCQDVVAVDHFCVYESVTDVTLQQKYILPTNQSGALVNDASHPVGCQS
mmetsp:Transcript_108792/g.340432  ORF Transcript_108792/g.340432 Transcript_108792/m.340432 type:complete len:88 (+) Transcript_108792:50-313(+)